MADPIDPYVDVWPPSHWSDVLQTPAPTLQPGLGVPPGLVDAAIPPVALPPGAPDPQHLAVAAGGPFPPPHWADDPGAPPPGQFGEPEIDVPPGAVAPQVQLPDAITGAGAERAPYNSVDEVLAAQGAPAPVIGKGDPTAVTQADHEAGDKAEIDRVAGLSQEQYAIEKDRHDQLAAVAAHDAEMKARLADLNQTKANVDAHLAAVAKAQQATDQVQADALKLANTKVDPDQWMNSKSTPQKILLAISAIVGGLAAGRSGGRNVGLDMIQKSIEKNIAVQGANLANQWKGLEVRKAGAAEQLARAHDTYQANETVRLASWEYAKNQLLAEQANFDPRGTTALRIGGTIQQIHAIQAKALQDFQQKDFENHIKIAEVQQKADAAAQADRHATATEKLTAWGHSLTAEANRGAREDRQIAAQDRRDAKATVESDKLAEHARKYGIPGLKLDDGSTDKTDANGAVLAANTSDEAAQALRDRVTATRNIVGIVDKMTALRTGYTSDTLNSDENQRLHELDGQLDMALKEFHKIKNITETDVPIFQHMKGYKDPTQRKSAAEGMAQLREQLIDSANGAIHGAGIRASLDLPKFEKPTNTPSEDATQFAGESPTGATPFLDLAGFAGLKSVVAGSVEANQAAIVMAKASEEYAGASPAQREVIRAQIQKLSTNAKSEIVKHEATQALQRIDLNDQAAAGSLGASEIAPAPETAHDPAPRTAK